MNETTIYVICQTATAKEKLYDCQLYASRYFEHTLINTFYSTLYGKFRY